LRNKVKKYHNNHPNEFDLEVINTATNKRITEGRTIFNRIFIGGFKMIKLLLEMFKTIKKFQPTVTHITTSGSLALIRDYFFIRIAKYYKISIVTHLHYGRRDLESPRQSGHLFLDYLMTNYSQFPISLYF